MERSNKRRFSALISEESYNNVSNFCKHQELINTKITPGSVLEISIRLFFRELEARPLEDMVVEYLTGSSGGANE